MKYKIEELKYITDSREIMQSKPTGFSKYMMYIIFFILSTVILWSLIATKQISIKASGVVKPSEEITKISSTLNGEVTTNNITEGMSVKSGDILLVINGEEYELQKTALEESLDSKEKELEANKKLKNSILDGVNYLNSNDEIEGNYSKMYDLYIENLKTGNVQVDSLDTQKESINKSISDLNLLLKSYKEEKNYLDWIIIAIFDDNLSNVGELSPYISVILTIVIVQTIILSIIEIATNGLTIGRMSLKIKVISDNGKYTIGKALCRNFIKSIGKYIFYISFISLLFNKNNKAFYDKILKTSISEE